MSGICCQLYLHIIVKKVSPNVIQYSAYIYWNLKESIVQHVISVGSSCSSVASKQHNLIFCSQELELLPTKQLQQNIYIRHPVSIEQYLMEGSYNKVFCKLYLDIGTFLFSMRFVYM